MSADTISESSIAIARQELQQAEDVVAVLFHDVPIHLLARRLAGAEIEVGPRLEGNERPLVQQRQTRDLAQMGLQERVVGLVQQDGRETGDGLVDRQGRQVAPLSQVESFRRP
jgi:hypothetical protein